MRRLAVIVSLVGLGACQHRPGPLAGGPGKWTFCGPIATARDGQQMAGARTEAEFQATCEQAYHVTALPLPDPAGYRITQVFPSAESPTGPFLPAGTSGYLRTTITCPAAGLAYYGLESENPTSIWVEGAPAFAAPTPLDHNETRLLPLRDADVVKLRCRPGPAAVVVRVTGLVPASRFWMYPVTPAVAAEIAARRLLSQPDALRVGPGGAVTAEPRLAEILGDAGLPLRITPRRPLRDAASGAEAVEVEVVAGSRAAVRAVVSALPKIAAAAPAAANGIQRARLALLASSPRNSSVEASAARTLAALADETAAATPGRFALVEYRGGVDGSPQSYGVVPNPQARRVLVVLPSHRQSACIESSPAGFLSENSDELDRLALVARDQGWAVLLPRLRNAQGALLAGADLDEVLADALPRFGMQGRPLVLAGRNMGGTEALMLAARFPGRFAGVIAVSPIFDPIGETCSSRWTGDDPRAWFAANGPLAVAEALGRTPVALVTEGRRLEVARTLADKLGALGGSAVATSTRTLEVRADGSDPLARLLGLLPPAPAGKRELRPVAAGPGPLHAIFTAPVRIVVGDGPADQANAAALARVWQGRQGGALPAPVALGSQPLPPGNVVLLAARPPAPWDRSSGEIAFGADAFVVHGARHARAERALAFIARRPDGLPGAVMMIASGQPLSSRLLDVLLDGFHDYYVLEPSANHVVDRGYLARPGKRS